MGRIELNAVPFSYVTHVLGVIAAVMVLVWSIHFRGGLVWESSNKNLIFNVIFIALSFFTLVCSFYYVFLHMYVCI